MATVLLHLYVCYLDWLFSISCSSFVQVIFNFVFIVWLDISKTDLKGLSKVWSGAL